ncbi:MAG: M28 family peptidase [Gemmatimonas sp.]|jgi:carboxypeptidase Q|uniref:M28 family peptidase n=1 Tax=Gemmatimonas sp. TaxID=1962908 RepID=UPI00391EF858|nr:M20/M25/M40 family metallo-hydrolase [Gemmatimonadota bacterium]
MLRHALLALSLVAATAAQAQRPGGPGGPPRTQSNPQGLPVSPAPEYVRTSEPTDPNIVKLWEEGMQRSQAGRFAQTLTDSIGPRLTGSPNMTRGQDWLLATYKQLGVSAKKERYGTWNSWKRGAAFAQLTAPRVKPLEATMLSWSGNTAGRWVDGDVVTVTPYRTPEEFKAWLPTVKGKIVLASAPRLTCRMPQQVAEFATPASAAALDSAQRDLSATYQGLTQRVPTFYADLKAAGAVAVFESNWSNFPGVDKIFGSPRNSALPTFDIGCEDYGMLFRLAKNAQGPKVKLMAESEFLGEQPVFNVIAEIQGASKPDEYVVLSAHFDSWEGHSGATDNGTGTVTMLEALRILKTVLPTPSRTIVVGHWSGEEQGLNGSGAWAADHPEVVKGLQFAFNQDNGTGRIVGTGPSILPENGPRLAQYMSQMPSPLTQYVRLSGPSGIGGGSDHASFLCYGAPAASLGALSWDYSNSTWHTNRDSFDKVMLDDLKHNATLTAMFAYLASEDPQRSSRTLMNPLPNGPNGQPITIPSCGKPQRESSGYRR